MTFKNKLGISQIAGVFVGLLCALMGNAGVILSPTGVVNNSLGNHPLIPTNSIDFTHDGSGLTAFASGVTDFSTYIATNPTHAEFAISNAWASAEGVARGTIDYDLGGVYSIARLALWNQDDGLLQGVGSFDIFTATDSKFLTGINVGSFTATDTSRAAQIFVLSISEGQYLRLQINSNNGSECCTTIGELAFDVSTTNAVPEPSILAILALGLTILARRVDRGS